MQLILNVNRSEVMRSQTEVKVASKNLAFLLAVGLAAVGGVAVLWSGSAEVAAASKALTLAGIGCNRDLADRGIKIETVDFENAGTDDPLWFCVDKCCKKLQPQNDGCPVYVPALRQYLKAECVDKISFSQLHESSVKLVASGGNAWMGNLIKIGDDYVSIYDRLMVLSTDPNKEMDGIKAKRGVSFKWMPSNIGNWHIDEDAPVPFYFCPYPWNVQMTTSDVAIAGTDDSLLFCVDDCCEKLNNAGENNYEQGNTEHFLSNCGAPTDGSTIKLVASGSDAWMGDLNVVFDDTVLHTSQPLVLSTDADDEITGINAKRGVSFKKQADGQWHYGEDVPFDWFPFAWNVKLTTSGVQKAATNDPLYLCVDDCCEKLDIEGIDDYEGYVPDYFLSNCDAPTDESSLKLVSSGGDAWMGQLESVFGQTVHHSLQPLVLSTQSSDEIDGIAAKHGATFKKQADGEWHYAEDVPFDYFLWNVEITTKDVSYAAMDGSLRFCVDDCCEKLNNNGEDNYERGRIDHFRSECKAPTDTSTLKLEATNGDGWMGTLQYVYGADVEFHSLVLSTQSSDKIDGTNAKRGATFQKGTDGNWHWQSDVSY